MAVGRTADLLTLRHRNPVPGRGTAESVPHGQRNRCSVPFEGSLVDCEAPAWDAGGGAVHAGNRNAPVGDRGVGGSRGEDYSAFFAFVVFGAAFAVAALAVVAFAVVFAGALVAVLV